VFVALGAALAVAVLGSLAPQALADSRPCGAVKHSRFGEMQYCPLWRGNVPVQSNTSQTGPVVGHLTHGGASNWFKYQLRGGDYWLNGYVNNIWAYTLSDDGHWGFVNEVYFSGGGQREPDAALQWWSYTPPPAFTNPWV
jgi:hypothetical protein